MQVEAFVQADARVKLCADFPISGRATEPVRTPSKRAPYRSGLAGTVRNWPETNQLTGRIMSR